jgi:hypothetical protein
MAAPPPPCVVTAQLYLRPFLAACEQRHTRLVPLALASIAKLVQRKLVGEEGRAAIVSTICVRVRGCGRCATSSHDPRPLACLPYGMDAAGLPGTGRSLERTCVRAIRHTCVSSDLQWLKVSVLQARVSLLTGCRPHPRNCSCVHMYRTYWHGL